MNATKQPPKLGYVIVYVPDVARAVSFYERVRGSATLHPRVWRIRRDGDRCDRVGVR